MFRLEHKNLLKIMQSLGYPGDDNGICQGVAMMGIQSFLVGELTVFNNRLNFILTHPDLHAAIMRVKEKLARESIASEPPKKLNLSEEEQNIIDTLAFFDGINLYQHPLNYPACLGSSVTQFHTDIISKITQSTQLERKGGLIKVMSWPGIYNDSELERYVRFLDEIAAKVNHSFPMLIESDNHSVAILYDHIAAGWKVLDANQLPVVPEDTAQLAVWIKRSLFECGEMTAFESSIYLPGDAADIAQHLDAAIKQSPEFMSLHAITEHKKNASNSRNATLAFVAAQKGHADVIKTLHKTGADLNQARNDGVTPAIVAAHNGHVEVIKALCNTEANLSQARNDGVTPAFVAAQNGHTDVIKVLHQAGIDLSQARNDGVTPALIAAQHGNADVIKMLHQAGVALNQAENNGITPALIAAYNGHADVIKVLHQAGVDLNQADNNGITPAFIAAQNGHINVLVALEVANVDLRIRTPLGTPLKMATRMNHTDCVNFLTDYTKRKSSQHNAAFFQNQCHERSQSVQLSSSDQSDVPSMVGHHAPIKS